MGLLLVVTGLLFLFGAQNQLGQWMIETFPGLSTIEAWLTPGNLREDILKKGGG